MNWKSTQTKELARAILSLKTEDEVLRFLRDLMTEEEIAECSSRWRVAQMLDEGVSYQTIQQKTGLSSTTVARISRWLQDGMNGYRLALDRSHHGHTYPS